MPCLHRTRVVFYIAVRPHNTCVYRVHVHHNSAALYWSSKDLYGHFALIALSRSSTRYCGITPSNEVRRRGDHASLSLFCGNSVLRFTRSHCQSRMNQLSDQSSKCKSGIVYGHNMVRNAFVRYMFRPEGFSAQLKAQLRIPSTNLPFADVLGHPRAPPPSADLDRPIASEISARRPYKTFAIRRAALSAAIEATLADEKNVRKFKRAFCANMSLVHTAATLDLSFDFVLLAVNTLGASVERAVKSYRLRVVSIDTFREHCCDCSNPDLAVGRGYPRRFLLAC